MHPAPLLSTGAPIDFAALGRARPPSDAKCGLLEAAPGEWVDVDCARYSPSAKARVVPALRKARAAHKTSLRLDVPHAAGAKLAASVDHRLDGTEGPVKDQGAVPASTAFSLSSAMDNAIRRLNKPDTISPLHLWAHYGWPNVRGAADGNWHRPIATWDVWSYSGAAACEFFQGAADHPCGAAYKVKPGSADHDATLAAALESADARGAWRIAAMTTVPRDPDAIAGVLATGADVWAALAIDPRAWLAARLDKDHVLPEWSGGAAQHAVVLAGYRAAAQGRQFLVHNSWGDRWGDKGYAWLGESSLRAHLTAAYTVKVEPRPVRGRDKIGAGDPLALTDDDCDDDELVDSVTGQCSKICPDDSRPANAVCPASAQPQPPPPGPTVTFAKKDAWFSDVGAGGATKIESNYEQVDFSADGSMRVAWESGTYSTAKLTTPSQPAGRMLSIENLAGVAFSPDGAHVAIRPYTAPLLVASTSDGRTEFQRAEGRECGAAFRDSVTLLFYDDGYMGYQGMLWRLDVGSGNVSSLSTKQYAEYCWPSANARTWILYDDGHRTFFTLGDGGGTPTPVVTNAGIPVAASPTADRVCYFRKGTDVDSDVRCTRLSDRREEILSTTGNDCDGLHFDDTGSRLLFLTSETTNQIDYDSVYWVADFAAETVTRLHGVTLPPSGSATLLSGGKAVATGSGGVATVYDLASHGATSFWGHWFFDVNPRHGKPRQVVIGQQTSDGWDLYTGSF